MITTRQNVVKVYSGKPGCMCGCRGNWTYSENAKSDCGYEPTRNERVVSRIYNAVMSNPDRITDVDAGCVYVNGNRNMVVYFG